MIKREDLTSQKMRRIAPEMDPLRIGMGWSIDDLSKPQIMVESTFGDSHPVLPVFSNWSARPAAALPRRAEDTRAILRPISATVRRRGTTA